jgi:protein-S-isoprenylcysteine O-methyltransferase Ste14
MGPARQIAAMMTVVIAFPLFLSWLLIHPFAYAWRKLGAFTYIIVLIFLAGTIAGIDKLYNVHEDLLYFGANYITAWLSIPCFIIAVIMAAYYYKHLDIGILIGLPEITRENYPGKLLTEGIYSRIRHPRYVGAFLFVLGLALVANAPISYVVAFLLIPLIYIIVFFEERELKKRFGPEYEKYCREVPRFFPKIF